MELITIQSKVLSIREKKVMLDFDLAEMYEVETRALKQAVRRNIERFPDDFMFALSDTEISNLVSQNVIPSKGQLGGAFPFAFTEQGVAMLSSVLKSKKALQVNITIMRAFVMIRQYYMDSQELKEKIESLENEMHIKFKDIHEALNFLLNPPHPDRQAIGFKREEK